MDPVFRRIYLNMFSFLLTSTESRLWAIFLQILGVLLWVSVFLGIVSAGIGFFAYFLSNTKNY